MKLTRRCDHDYVETAPYLHPDIGRCCRKCGSPERWHEHFGFSFRARQVAKILGGGWAYIAPIFNWGEIIYAVRVTIAAIVVILFCIVAPFLLPIAPVIGLAASINRKRKLRKRVVELFGQGGIDETS